MANSNLATYLNDHLAGSIVALELMQHLEKLHNDTEVDRLIASLRADVLVDRQELESLMHRLSISISSPRKAVAWLSGKFAEIKLALDDRGNGPLHLLEAVEAIAIGIHGKGCLWRSLAAARVEGLPTAELERLERRAHEQRQRIEKLRLDAALQAFQQEQ
jgi:hypothetical protein